MRSARFLAIPLVMIFVLACGLTSGIQGLATQMPGVLTSMPTALGEMETAGAQQSSTNCPSTPTAGGLGISLEQAKNVLQMSGQFVFADSSANGQPVSTATLTSGAAASFSAIANGFSAQFIGDPCNISKIEVTIPRTDQATADQGIGLITILFSGFMPPQAQLPLLTWLSQQYASIQVGDQQQTTVGNMQFTLQRSQTEMVLDIIPTP